jgi:hypothetical protein
MSTCPLDHWKIICTVRMFVVFYAGPVQIKLLGTCPCFCLATVRVWATGCFSHVCFSTCCQSAMFVFHPHLSANHHLFHDRDTFCSSTPFAA